MMLEAQRTKFAEYVLERKLNTMVVLDHSITVLQESTLKYERIDKYRVLHLSEDELNRLMGECSRLGISVWLGADKLCLGFNHRGNMRLSAFSVIPGCSGSGISTDRNCHPVLEESSKTMIFEDIPKGQGDSPAPPSYPLEVA